MGERRILVVDDSPIVRAVAASALGGAGFLVESIDDPRNLDGAVEASAFDLVLLDATFPNVDDDELVTIAARHSQELPILIFSDRASRELDELVSRSGAAGYVVKDGGTLVASVERFFHETS